VAGSYEEGDEPSGSGATELVSGFLQTQTLCFTADILFKLHGSIPLCKRP
jgi:hypothetical protein